MLDFSIRREIASAKSLRILGAIFTATALTIVLSGLFVGYGIMSAIEGIAFYEQESSSLKTQHWADGAVRAPSSVDVANGPSIWKRYTSAYSAWEILAHASIPSGIIVGLYLLSMVVWQWITIRRGGGWALGLAINGRLVDSPSTPEERQLINVVEEVAIAFSSAPPAIVVLDEEPGINAFAAGLSDDDQILCVTAGALRSLSRDQLQGIVAHEMSHLAGGDTSLGTLATSVIYGLRSIHETAASAVRYGWDDLQESSQHGDRNSGRGISLLMIPLGLLIWPVGFTGAALAHGLTILMNQQREYLADANAVARTRHPESLASALRVIADHPGRGKIRHRQSSLVAAMWFVSASGHDGRFSTHPPLRERILALDPNCERAASIDSPTDSAAIEQMERSVCTLLSLLSNCDGESSLNDYEFMRGWSRISNREIERRRLDEMTPEEVESAIGTIRECSPRQKEAFLDAAEQVVTTDHVRSPEETALLEKLQAALRK